MKKSIAGRIDRWTVAVLAVGLFGVAGLFWSANQPRAEGRPATEEPAVAHDVPGTDIKRVTITQEAARRLGLQTEKVTETTAGGKQLKAIPYSALFYDSDGETWTYAMVGPLAFQRQHLTVEGVANGLALLKEGPPIGTEVVTVGVDELGGVEFGVGEE